MEPRIQKGLITKKIRAYQNKGLRVIKIDQCNKEITGYYAIITPKTNTVYVNSQKTCDLPDKMTVPRFSDFVVRREEYNSFMEILRYEFS